MLSPRSLSLVGTRTSTMLTGLPSASTRFSSAARSALCISRRWPTASDPKCASENPREDSFAGPTAGGGAGSGFELVRPFLLRRRRGGAPDPSAGPAEKAVNTAMGRQCSVAHCHIPPDVSGFAVLPPGLSVTAGQPAAAEFGRFVPTAAAGGDCGHAASRANAAPPPPPGLLETSQYNRNLAMAL